MAAKAPVPVTEPAADTAGITGSLAETGSSSSTPMVALAGGADVVLGAGDVGRAAAQER